MQMKIGRIPFLFPRAVRKMAMPAWIFDECCVGQSPRPLGRKEQARSCPAACCGVFDLTHNNHKEMIWYLTGKWRGKGDGISYWRV